LEGGSDCSIGPLGAAALGAAALGAAALGAALGAFCPGPGTSLGGRCGELPWNQRELPKNCACAGVNTPSNGTAPSPMPNRAWAKNRPKASCPPRCELVPAIPMAGSF